MADATDAAVALAAELGVDLDTIEGTGKGGRVTVGDVRNANASGTEAVVAPPPSPEVLDAPPEETPETQAVEPGDPDLWVCPHGDAQYSRRDPMLGLKVKNHMRRVHNEGEPKDVPALALGRE